MTRVTLLQQAVIYCTIVIGISVEVKPCLQRSIREHDLNELAVIYLQLVCVVCSNVWCVCTKLHFALASDVVRIANVLMTT